MKINFAWQLEKGHYCSLYKGCRRFQKDYKNKHRTLTGGICSLTEKCLLEFWSKGYEVTNEFNLGTAAGLCYRQRVAEIRFLLKLYIQLCVYLPWCAKSISLWCAWIFFSIVLLPHAPHTPPKHKTLL